MYTLNCQTLRYDLKRFKKTYFCSWIKSTSNLSPANPKIVCKLFQLCRIIIILTNVSEKDTAVCYTDLGVIQAKYFKNTLVSFYMPRRHNLDNICVLDTKKCNKTHHLSPYIWKLESPLVAFKKISSQQKSTFY